jgi:hypothetical protein
LPNLPRICAFTVDPHDLGQQPSQTPAPVPIPTAHGLPTLTEGNDDGFLSAENGVHGFGDAGIAASLDDMQTWETHIDDPSCLYNRLSAPVTFRDESPASYGYGLRWDNVGGIKVTDLGSGLRGFSGCTRRRSGFRWC